MKYSSSNKPLVCMQTQSSCYKGTEKMTIKGVLWHSTGANNPTLRRYVQPSDTKPSEDTYDKNKWLEVLGKNSYKNDWNHIDMKAGLNCWIGKLADGTVTTVQTMPWDYRPWGCGSGSKGSCNSGWIQFEICEDGLKDKDYFDKVYTEACEITAYLCKLYNIDPKGSATVNGVKVPTILCHADSYKLGLGSNHGDVNHWFPKHGKSMETVRNDVAALLNSVNNSVANEVKTYKIVTPINRYTTAADAAAQKNAKSEKLQVGTYYIYNKYPDGINGMYNISTDKTGASAGSWINPKENVLQEVVPEVQKLYRVRKSKDDTKSQIGAYSSLQNAINACQSAGSEYHVFDWDYAIVYSYKAPEVQEESTPKDPVTPPIEAPVEKEPEKIVAVYDLSYPETVKIVDKSVNRTNADCTKAIVKILSNNADFDIEIAKAFFKLAPSYGIDPMMAISQSILETGWFKFAGSSVKPDQNNYCGLGATGGGVAGASFSTVEDGVRAQLQHLFAYGCKDGLPEGESLVDPRFNLVTRGIATNWQQLAGRWACPGYSSKTYETPQKAMEAGDTYGQKIHSICKMLIAENVSAADIEKYFPTQKEDEDCIIDTPVIDVTNDDAKTTNLAIFLFNCIKKLLQMIVDALNKK